MTCDPEPRPTPANSLLTFAFPPPPDDYATLLMAEALLEECLVENMDLLRSSTPLVDKMQPKLCRAKGHLNTILSRGRLTVSLLLVPSDHQIVVDGSLYLSRLFY